MHTREIIPRSFHQPHHRSSNPLRVKPLTVQRINLGCNREGTLSASHNVVLILADDESALPICFRASEETRPCPYRGRDRPFRVASPSREITDPLCTSSLNLLSPCQSIRRHESCAMLAIEFRTGAPISRMSRPLIARVIALDRQPIDGIDDNQNSFSRD